MRNSVTYDLKTHTKIYIAGHRGMVGSALFRKLTKAGYSNVLTAGREVLDLRQQGDVFDFFHQKRPDLVFLAAATVGGIHANDSRPADFIYDNLMIQTNVVRAAFENGVKRLIFLGSSCIYPSDVAQPMSEDALLTASLEPTNEPYAIAKIAGIKLCESFNRQFGVSHGIDYRSLMPTNLYGPGDNFHETDSHVVPALIRRFHEATKKSEDIVKVWGSGAPKREFLYVDDLADACICLAATPADKYKGVAKSRQSHLNAGSGQIVTIADLAVMLAELIGFKGKIIFDHTRPDGTMEKAIDSEKMSRLGWKAETSLEEGLKLTYRWFVETESKRA